LCFSIIMSTMNRQINSKLQNLLQTWPTGTVSSTKWLARMGISRQLANVYKKSGWISPFGTGTFSKAEDKVDCYGALYTLQRQLDLNVHAGGKTALELLGLAHNIPIGQQTIDLLFAPHSLIPRWFNQHSWQERVRIIENNALPPKIGIEEISMGNFTIKASSRERAALELLCLTPRLYTFEETRLIMESLGTLRADVLNKLLLRCSSEKTKRLLLYFGDELKHPWRSKINKGKCKIGTSLLKIASKNGKYHAKYKLFLPMEYVIEHDQDIRF
jgi:hypothetical protein